MDNEFDCRICNKVFKSQGQMNNHLNSKQHIKKKKEIIREVGLCEEIE